MRLLIIAIFLIPLFALVWQEMCIQDKKVSDYDKQLDQEDI